MEITVWNDYICPWAYAARPLTAWLRTEAALHEVTIVQRSFELHPDIPAVGAPVRPSGRLDLVFEIVSSECAKEGLEFRKPVRSPNSHLALQIAEITNDRAPTRFVAVDEALARAHWVEGRAIDDPEVLAEILEEAGTREVGLDPDSAFGLVADGIGAQLLAASQAAAHDVGIAATPAWLIDDFAITGLQPRAQFERWMSRVLARTD